MSRSITLAAVATLAAGLAPVSISTAQAQGYYDSSKSIVVTAPHKRTEGRSATGAPIEVRLPGPPDIIASLYVRRLERSTADGPELILHFLDITDQKRLETQVAQSQKMQAVGQLAGGIAHDFNNLLTAMIGFCDLLLLRHRAGDQSFADIMQIKQNANRAANLVRQLLAFSRQQTLQPRVLNVTDVLAELSHLRLALPSRRHHRMSEA